MKNEFYRSKHPAYYGLVMGLCYIFDGLVLLLTCGKVGSAYSMHWGEWYMRRKISHMRRNK